MEDHHLLRPLIPPTTTTISTPGIEFDSIETTTTSSNSGIINRLVLVIFIGITSVWANYEASKGFSITILNEAGNTSPAGKSFGLFYVSNDKATRIVLNASQFVENILYPNDSYPKKQVSRVILRLAGRNLTDKVIVESNKSDEFVLNLCPTIMKETSFSYAMLSAVQRGMALIWLWDGQGDAPSSIIQGMVEHISSLAGFSMVTYHGSAGPPESDGFCWKGENPRAVAHFLDYCEVHKGGFIRELNQAMRDGWDDELVDNMLRMAAKHLCQTDYFSERFVSQHTNETKLFEHEHGVGV